MIKFNQRAEVEEQLVFDKKRLIEIAQRKIIKHQPNNNKSSSKLFESLMADSNSFCSEKENLNHPYKSLDQIICTQSGLLYSIVTFVQQKTRSSKKGTELEARELLRGTLELRLSY